MMKTCSLSNSPRIESNALRRGDYKFITRLVRLLSRGTEIKQQADMVIDTCNAMQNLRTAIYELKQRSETAVKQQARRVSHERAVNYLIRYGYLIVLNAYLRANSSKSSSKQSFSEWLDERPEIVRQFTQTADITLE
jgi:hypothetical protein